MRKHVMTSTCYDVNMVWEVFTRQAVYPAIWFNQLSMTKLCGSPNYPGFLFCCVWVCIVCHSIDNQLWFLNIRNFVTFWIVNYSSYTWKPLGKLKMIRSSYIMMTSSNGNIFRVTAHLCGQFTGHRWIPHTNASDAELCCFLWSAPEWTME